MPTSRTALQVDVDLLADLYARAYQHGQADAVAGESELPCILRAAALLQVSKMAADRLTRERARAPRAPLGEVH